MYNYHRCESDNIKYYPGGITAKQAQARKRRWYQLFDLSGSFVTALVILFIVFTFLCRAVNVVGSSMQPTLADGNWLLVSDEKTYERGDIIIITQPNELDNEPLVKRIIATGGETIDIDFNTHEVYVNGKLLDEPYIKEPTALQYDVKFPYVVSEGCVFAMGDNRNDSIDSRSSRVGPIDERYILGKAVFRVLPISDFKFFGF